MTADGIEGRLRSRVPRVPRERGGAGELEPGSAAGPSRYRRAVWPLLGSVVLIGVLFLAVFPTRTYLAQRGTIADGEERLRVIEEQNTKLEDRVRALDTDAEIERLAREQYNLVMPGEESYAILPAPPPAITIPDVWPISGLQEKLTGRPADVVAADDEGGTVKSDPATTTTTASGTNDD